MLSHHIIEIKVISHSKHRGILVKFHDFVVKGMNHETRIILLDNLLDHHDTWTDFSFTKYGLSLIASARVEGFMWNLTRRNQQTNIKTTIKT